MERFWQDHLNAGWFWDMSLAVDVLSHHCSDYHLCRILSITLGNSLWLTLGEQYLAEVNKRKHSPGAPVLSLCSARAGVQQVCFNRGLFSSAGCLYLVG